MRSPASQLSSLPLASTNSPFGIALAKCQSQIGSGSLPIERLDSIALVLRPVKGSVNRLADSFRALPVPVIGRVQDGALWLDLRCLEDEAKFLGQLSSLRVD